MTHDQIVAGLSAAISSTTRESRRGCYPIRKPTPRPKLRQMPDAPLSPDKPDPTGFGDGCVI
jgi:hypothetical protein